MRLHSCVLAWHAHFTQYPVRGLLPTPYMERCCCTLPWWKFVVQQQCQAWAIYKLMLVKQGMFEILLPDVPQHRNKHCQVQSKSLVFKKLVAILHFVELGQQKIKTSSVYNI